MAGIETQRRKKIAVIGVSERKKEKWKNVMRNRKAERKSKQI